jgi:hypothetical protein
MLTDAQLDALARLAADAVVLAVRWGPADPGPIAPADDMLTTPGASFVTLRHGTAVRGCVGSLSAYRALHRDVAENARAAALRDQRFEPLLPAELAETHVEVAVLTATSLMPFADERDLYGQLRPGVDGLIVAYEDVLATYLPEVWDLHPEPEQFVAELRLKAGIDPAVPVSDLAFQRFAARHSALVSLDREAVRRRDLKATWWRWRWHAREQVRRLVRRQATHASQR